MSQRVLHLSDTHVTASGVDEDGVDALTALDQILEDCQRIPDLDMVVVTGDIADDGSADGCALVRDRVAQFTADRVIPHVYTTGNHDRPAGFTQALGTGHIRGAADIGDLIDSTGFRAAVSEHDGLRIVTLDSLIPGAVHGEVSPRQLAGLARLLETSARHGTIVALHHPPIHTPAARWMAEAGLRNRDALANVIGGTDVVAVLCGHFHAQLSGQLAGVPVWVTPGVVTRVDLTAPPDMIRAVNGASATVVELGGPFSPSFHVLHARDSNSGQQVYEVAR